MTLWPSLKERIYVPELMDDPACDPQKLARTYRELAWINFGLSRMRGLLNRFVLADVEKRGKPAHILEVGCGGGDMLAYLARACQTRGLDVRLTGIDNDDRALANARAKLRGHDNVHIKNLSLAQLQEHSDGPDYVFCNHVLHHIPPHEVAKALHTMQKAASRRLLVNDLRRSHLAYASYTMLAAVAFHNSFTFHDGRLSIRKGFTVAELKRLVQQAQLPESSQVGTAFPARIYLVAPGTADKA